MNHNDACLYSLTSETCFDPHVASIYSDIVDPFARAKEICPDFLNFSPEWIAKTSATVMVDYSNIGVSGENEAELATVYANRAVSHVWVLSHDWAATSQDAHLVEATEAAMTWATSEIFGLAFMVIPATGDLPVLFISDADYKLFAGSKKEIADFFEPYEKLVDIKQKMYSYVRNPTNPSKGDQLLMDVLPHMDWINTP